MLVEWLTWLCNSPKDDNWEIHVGWRMNATAANTGFQFCVINDGPDLSHFFDPEDVGEEEEMTIMIVDSDELRAIVDRTNGSKI